MPRDKDLKRLVRARMKKTGEAYTTARVQVTRKRARKSTSTASRARPAGSRITSDSIGPDRYAAVAGMSDAVLREKTGHPWAHWVDVLDREGAATMAHRDVARIVSEKFKVRPWWTQMVTVGYERIRGRRAKGQRMDGTYEASKSRTYPVSVTALFEAWADPGMRKRWMDGTNVTVRTATAPKSMRLGLPDRGIVAVWFQGKGKGKSAVSLSHAKLPDRATADRMKQYWSERLDALGEVLTASVRS